MWKHKHRSFSPFPSFWQSDPEPYSRRSPQREDVHRYPGMPESLASKLPKDERSNSFDGEPMDFYDGEVNEDLETVCKTPALYDEPIETTSNDEEHLEVHAEINHYSGDVEESPVNLSPRKVSSSEHVYPSRTETHKSRKSLFRKHHHTVSAVNQLHPLTSPRNIMLAKRSLQPLVSAPEDKVDLKPICKKCGGMIPAHRTSGETGFPEIFKSTGQFMKRFLLDAFILMNMWFTWHYVTLWFGEEPKAVLQILE